MDTLTLGHGNSDVFYGAKGRTLTNIVEGRGVTTNIIDMDFSTVNAPGTSGSSSSLNAMHFVNASGSVIHAVKSEEVWQGVTILHTTDGGQVNLWNIMDQNRTFSGL